MWKYRQYNCQRTDRWTMVNTTHKHNIKYSATWTWLKIGEKRRCCVKVIIISTLTSVTLTFNVRTSLKIGEKRTCCVKVIIISTLTSVTLTFNVRTSLKIGEKRTCCVKVIIISTLTSVTLIFNVTNFCLELMTTKAMLFTYQRLGTLLNIMIVI
jgi:hypothetical protein